MSDGDEYIPGAFLVIAGAVIAALAFPWGLVAGAAFLWLGIDHVCSVRQGGHDER